MQKSMFLNKKLDTAHHLLKLGTGVIKGVVTARIFSTGRMLMHF